jgi:hypothetical protein
LPSRNDLPEAVREQSAHDRIANDRKMPFGVLSRSFVTPCNEPLRWQTIRRLSK